MSNPGFATPPTIASGPIRLLHVFPTFKVGGSQVRFATIANHFGSRFRHQLFAMDGEYECCDRLNSNLVVELLKIAVRKGHTLTNLRNFRVAVRDVCPDVLVTYNWGAIEWGMANFPGLVRHIHIEDGFGPEEAQTQLARRRWTRRLVLRRSTVILPSMTLRRIALETWRLKPQHVFYIPNGIDCSRFSAFPSAPTRPSTGTLTIGTVAALRREKNLARLIRAFRRMCDQVPCRLLIAGDGPERQSLEDLARNLGVADKVSFTGHLDDPATIYSQFDVFALSSDTEQMPYTVIEAMAAGLPVAASDVGDIGQMVAAPNQPYIVLPQPDALASAFLTLLRDPALRHAIGAANQARARDNFDQARMLENYAALFRGEDRAFSQRPTD